MDVTADKPVKAMIRAPESQLGAHTVNIPAPCMYAPPMHLQSESTAISVSSLAAVLHSSNVLDEQPDQDHDVSAPASTDLRASSQHVGRALDVAAEPLDFEGMIAYLRRADPIEAKAIMSHEQRIEAMN